MAGGMGCRTAKLEEQLTRLPAMDPAHPKQGKYILVAHSAVIRHLFDQFIGGRKPDNIGMVRAHDSNFRTQLRTQTATSQRSL